MRRPRIDPGRSFPYYEIVAERKNSGRESGRSKNSKNISIGVIFWAAFFIVVAGFFMVNRETIKKNFAIIAQTLNLPSAAVSETASGPDDKPVEVSPNGVSDTRQPSVALEKPDKKTSAPPAAPVVTPEAEPAGSPAAPSSAAQPSSAASSPASQSSPASRSSSQPAAQPSSARQSAAQKPAETRERSLYFAQVDKDGIITRSKVTRKIILSDSPMQDCLKALLSGPSADEQRRSIVSFIPGNTRILSAAVRGSTAYISFSEDFQYNTYGVEGYAAQLRQIVWTATEFANIKDVQILIEGRRVDYLGEGIWIGSPVNRDSF
jgi:spore germination protein GerM